MYIVLIVFMAIAAVVCIFAMVTVIVDMVKVQASQPVVVQPPVESAEPAEDDEAMSDDSSSGEEEYGENTVIISRTEKKTLDEKFRELDEQQQHYYVEIVKHAMSKPETKQLKNDRYEEYKIGNTRLVRLQIKKSGIVCEVTLVNSDFRNYMTDNKVRIKQAPTVIKISDESSVELVKNGIDIAVRGVEEEREYKRQLRNERRRNSRRQNT